ncbi:MAG: hypothetical protein WBD65_13895, partial [Methylocella sp.]
MKTGLLRARSFDDTPERATDGGLLHHIQNFIAVDREQAWLMPPSLQNWLPEDHYAWFVLASVEQVDLSAFVAWYRP